MPTGYTSDIYEGKNVSGKEFLLSCARAFGALIDMRDDPMDAPIRDSVPSDYHVKRLAEAESDLSKYQNMSDEDIQQQIDEEYDKAIIEHEKSYKNTIDMRNRYLKTLAQVKKWQPPTSEHVELKKFAVDQLEGSIDFDCHLDYYDKYKPVKRSSKEWITDRINSCLKDIEYHSKEYRLEVDRCNERNKWVADLRSSLEIL